MSPNQEADVQQMFEQHGFELCGFAFTQIFFLNKYIGKIFGDRQFQKTFSFL